MDLFPAKNRLLAACRGDVRDNHPLLRWACELSEIHQQLLAISESAHSEADQRRVSLANNIDVWVGRQLPLPLGAARVHTETLGSVVNRLAQLTAAAYVALANPADEGLLEIWERLGELAVGYEDLVAELSSGRRRLPYAQ